METTRVFKNGGSLAVRLPAKYALPIGEVLIDQKDGKLTISPVDENGWPSDMDEWFSQDVGELPIKDRSKDSKSIEL